jgi:hypothetical protein
VLEPGDAEFDELLDLAERAIGAGLLPAQRHRWRELVIDLLGKLGEPATDRRLRLRGHPKLPVRFWAPKGRSTLFTTTLSAGGISVETPEPPPVGTRLRLAIDTQLRAAPVLATVEVAWSKPGQDGSFGALFVDLLAPDRELLEGIAISEMLAAALK